MSRSQCVAESLLGVLDEYADVLDVGEDHFSSAANKEFPNLQAEKDSLSDFQENHQLPMMVKCKEAGFTYADLMLIIPGAFKTTYAERRRVFEDLVKYVGKKYGVRYDWPV